MSLQSTKKGEICWFSSLSLIPAVSHGLNKAMQPGRENKRKLQEGHLWRDAHEGKEVVTSKLAPKLCWRQCRDTHLYSMFLVMVWCTPVHQPYNLETSQAAFWKPDYVLVLLAFSFLLHLPITPLYQATDSAREDSVCDTTSWANLLTFCFCCPRQVGRQERKEGRILMASIKASGKEGKEKTCI